MYSGNHANPPSQYTGIIMAHYEMYRELYMYITDPHSVTMIGHLQLAIGHALYIPTSQVCMTTIQQQ